MIILAYNLIEGMFIQVDIISLYDVEYACYEYSVDILHEFL